jgi:hypothetical protein
VTDNRNQSRFMCHLNMLSSVAPKWPSTEDAA